MPQGSEPPGMAMVRENVSVRFVLTVQSYNSLPEPVTYTWDPFGETAMPYMEAPFPGYADVVSNPQEGTSTTNKLFMFFTNAVCPSGESAKSTGRPEN